MDRKGAYAIGAHVAEIGSLVRIFSKLLASGFRLLA